jgi:hypothetical protein
MDHTPKTTCPKCHGSKVYRVTNPPIEETDTPIETAGKQGLRTWNCATCWHQWPARVEDEQLNPSIWT